MAIAVTHIVSTGSVTDATSYNLPSANYDANVLILFAMNHSKATAPDIVTITGLTGATWEQVDDRMFNTTPSQNRLQLWRTMIGTSANTITITASFAGTQTGFLGSIDQISGVATSGSNGSAAVVQSTCALSTATSITVTLASTPTQAVYGAVGTNLNSNIGTPSGFTETVDEGQGSPNKRLMTCYSTTPATTMTSTQGGTIANGAILLEFALQSTGAPSATIYGTRRLLCGVGV